MLGVITYTKPDDLDHLRGLGIVIRKIAPNPRSRPDSYVWDASVELDEAVLSRLDPFWGRYIWTLE